MVDFLQEPICLRAHVRPVIPPDGDTVVLVSEQETCFLDGKVYTRLVPLLDGCLNAAAISRQLSAEFSKQDVIKAIVALHREGHLTIFRNRDSAPTQRFWESTRGKIAQPGAARVEIHAFDDTWEDYLAGSLRELDVAADRDRATLTVMLVENYLDPTVQETARQASGPVLMVKPVGVEGWIGPLIVPGKSACWECLAQRLRLNRPAQQLFAQIHGATLPHESLPTSIRTMLNAAAMQIGNWFFADKQRLHNQLLTFNTITGQSHWHTIVRRPQCPACGTGESSQPSPVRLESRPRSDAGAIGHRLIPVEQMIQAYQHHVSSITGVVPELTEITDDGITHVCRAGQSSPQPAADWKSLVQRQRNNASGKGVQTSESKASALGEALERYSSYSDGTENVVHAAFGELGDDAIHPNTCMLFSSQQLGNYEEINRQRSGSFRHRVPRPLNDDQPIDWIKTWSVTHQSWRYVAAEFALLGYKPSEPDRYCVGESNGNAAGTCLEDAILQGFLELVERDSVALWWYNRIARTSVSLEGIHDEYVHALKKHYAKINREFWLLDLTSDLKIPALVAISRRVDDGPDETVMGFGAHLDPRVAASRALTEMNQLMPANLRQAERIDRQMPQPGDPVTALDISLDEHPYLLPDPNQAEKQIEDIAVGRFDDLRDEVEFCRETIERQGMELIVVDLTRPDIGLPVVKVIVPGMRHFWRRLAPGRLYSVPLQMGWVSDPMTEQTANPIDLHA